MNTHLPLLLLAAALIATGCSRPPEPSQSLEVAARTVHSGALSRDGHLAVVGSALHGGSLWQVDTRERRYDWNHQEGELTLLQATAISPDGHWAATSDGQAVVLWSIDSGEADSFWNMTGDIRQLALGRHGNVAALVLEDGRAALYDLRAGNLLASFTHRGPVNTIAVTDDLSLTISGGDDNRARVWHNNSGEAVSEQTYTDPVQLVAISADGKRALAAARYDRVDVFDPHTGELHWRLPFTEERTRRGLTISSARFSEDGQYLLTGRPDGIVQLWDLAEQREIYRWQLAGRKAWQPVATIALDVSFSADPSKYFALSSDGFVHTLSY